MNKSKKISYAQAGVNYESLDAIKTLAQKKAFATAGNLLKHGASEISDSRGESAYVWKAGNIYMASVIEGLGTKNLVADGMRTKTGKTYYDIIGYDTVATIMNDLVSVGATPLVLHAYWATAESAWMEDTARVKDFIRGWSDACNDAGVSWGGGETPTLKGIIAPGTVDLGGSAVGMITQKKHLLTDKKLRADDVIVMLRSAGINANGLSLARAVAKKLPHGYRTLLMNRMTYGEALLQKTHIYAGLVQELFKSQVDIHYISNITGHGFKKIMRAKPSFTYVIDRIVEPQEVFRFLQKEAHLSDSDMYQTFNMGLDYALFIPKKDIKKTLNIITKQGFTGIVAGHVEKGEKRVVIQPKNIVYTSDSFQLRS